MEKLNNYINEASIFELNAVDHIGLCVFVLICLFSMATAYYGNYIFIYFKLDKRICILSSIIKLRNEFQHIIIFFNFYTLCLRFSIFIQYI